MDDTSGAPLITTVIRAYNRANTIDRALRSALAQTLPGQPIVVVDDASSDETPERVRAYGERIRLIVHDENRGPGAAGNTGLAAVETPFVAFLDSDDVWDPLFLERMLAALQADPTKVFAYCNQRIVHERASLDFPVDRPPPPPGPGDVVKSLRAVTSATAGLTAALQRLGGFQGDLWYGEDHDLQIRCAFRYPGGFVRLPEYLVEYHVTEDSLNTNFDYNIRAYIKMIEKYLQHPELKDLRPCGGRIKSKHLLGITGRKFVQAQLSKTSTRSVSLIVLNGGDPDAVRASLKSAAAQALPPVEAAVLAPASPGLDRVLREDWPFHITGLDTVGQASWSALRYALAIFHSELLAFLNAGDAWTDIALDRHRRAFSSSLNRVTFSYGGFAHLAHGAVPLDNDSLQKVHQMIDHWAPGSLSAMVVDRQALGQLTNLPLPAHYPLWLAIASRLSLEHPGPAVRIRDRVVAHGEKQKRDATAIHELLTTLSETRAGMSVANLAERLNAGKGGGDPLHRLRKDGSQDGEPLC